MKMVYQGIIERAEDGTFWAYVTEFPTATGVAKMRKRRAVALPTQ